VHYLGDEEDRAARIAAGSRSGDVIATLGAGDIFKMGGEVLNALSAEVKVHEGA
jgi:UDP-N-acetylmuramate-alanine ligase